MNERIKTLTDSLVSNANWINSVIVAGLLLCLTVVLIKLFAKNEEPKVLGVPIPLRFFWIIVAGLTIAHVYCTILFCANASELFYIADDSAKMDAFWKLSKGGPLFFRGLVRRSATNGGFFVEMDMRDSTTWLAHAAAILVIVALTQWRKRSWWQRILSIVVAIMLLSVNWVAGTNWAFATSQLYVNNF